MTASIVFETYRKYHYKTKLVKTVYVYNFFGEVNTSSEIYRYEYRVNRRTGERVEGTKCEERVETENACDISFTPMSPSEVRRMAEMLDGDIIGALMSLSRTLGSVSFSETRCAIFS